MQNDCDFLERTEGLFGTDAITRLQNSKVIIFGLGGVGGHALEVIVRSGVGEIALVDSDKVDVTNINRQIIALHSNIGRPKVDVAEERIRNINPTCKVKKNQMRYSAENADSIDVFYYDYVVDCIDDVPAKMELIKRIQSPEHRNQEKTNHPTFLISAMGAGNKVDATKIRISDIYKTAVDPLAKIIRKKCKEAGIKKLKVAYSEEQPLQTDSNLSNRIYSNAFVPSSMGILIGSEVVKDLIKLQ